MQLAEDGRNVLTDEAPGEDTPGTDGNGGNRRQRAAAAVRTPFWRGLLGITGIGLVIRVAFTWIARRYQDTGFTDQFWYWQAGRMLAEGHGFGNPFEWAFGHSNAPGGQPVLDFGHRYVPSAGHPPLYPLFLGAVNWLGFDKPFHDRLASCVLGAIAVLFIGLAARELAGNRAGLIAAGLGAVYPMLWINDGQLMSESLYIPLIALTLWSVARFWKKPTFGRIALVSLWVGLGALTRSEAFLLYPLAVLPVCLRAPGLEWRAKFERLGLAALIAMILIGPWVAYNQGRFEHRVFIVSGSGVAMDYGNCDETYSGPFIGYWSLACPLEEWPNTKDESVIDAAMRKHSLHYLREHLSEFPKVATVRVLRVYHLWDPAQGVRLDQIFERRGFWPTWAGVIMFYPVTLLAIYGGVLAWKRKLAVSPYIAITFVTTMAAALTFGITRYRVAFDVGACILAGLAVDALWTRWTAREAEAGAEVGAEAGELTESPSPA